MCAPLIVTCGCAPLVVKQNRATHYVVCENLLVPCKNAGDRICKAGLGEIVDFQNPSTECAGCLAGHSPYSQAAKEICEASLKKYAEAVYKANEKNFTGEKLSRKGWFFGLF
ncbi:hypothetical protein CKM354_000280000 [Cercospora kikuchii]|uniref:Uncharacterized protein n=1 Tax=Cercospora kikuchii TaxID=84275 RepID=A0A9P3CA02_9PEZI|nr:uncharacterized protein CKM354_000280000 [Cercospora kikuchii]GIZ39417.1 hypothetical protein CKM354_000280000 [Cercospora kikuchii]